MVVLKDFADSGQREAFLHALLSWLKSTEIGLDHVVSGSPADSGLGD